MNKPKFSILIPVIKAKFLCLTIDSVLSQTFEDYEIVIYNDCSPDNIEKVINKYSDNRIRYYKGEKNIGNDDPSKTWNIMLKIAKGEYLCLLGDDDILAFNYLTEINLLIEKNPFSNLFRSKLRRIDETGKIIQEDNDLPQYETLDKFLYERLINNRIQSTSEFVIKKSEIIRIGGYINFPRACGSDDATYLTLMKNSGIISTNNTYACWRKNSLNISDNDNQEINKEKVKYITEWKKNFIENVFLDKDKSNILYKKIKNCLKERNIEIEKKEKNNFINNFFKNKEEKYNKKYFSNKRILIIFKKILFFLIKDPYKRKKVISILRDIIVRLLLVITIQVRKIKPRKKRKININSKKIVYVGHSYHSKTKSTDFLINYLEQFFEVEKISNTSWENGELPDLSFVNDKYLGVIFFQLLPPRKVLDSIKNDNIIFFPMYDGVRKDYLFWSNFKDLKIINFSKTLHDKLKKWGLDSIHLQYFPEPKEFNPGRKDEVFFWQRMTHININTITKLFKVDEFKIHLHKAVDPWQQFVKPTEKQEKFFNITYSDWFENREDLDELIKGKGIFISPREYEGIGMSFLGAMAMGKAIIAIDNPTMNEYIIDKKTGYLFDLSDPKEINLDNIKEIQKNAYEYICDGYKIWEKEKIKIIEFIKN